MLSSILQMFCNLSCFRELHQMKIGSQKTSSSSWTSDTAALLKGTLHNS